jgi:hypothetical protein
VSATLSLSLLLAVLSAGALNWAYYRQHGQVATLAPLSLRQPARSLRHLFSDRRWLVGFVVGLLGWAFYIAALRFGPLSLVQAASAGGIGVLALLVWRWGGVTLSRREWTGVSVSIGGLAALGLSLVGSGGAHHPSVQGSWLAIVVWLVSSGLVAGFLVVAGPRLLAPGAGFGIGAGILYAAGDVATKSAVAGGWRSLFVLALLAAHGLGFILLQLSFQRGKALTTAGAATLFSSAVPIAAGMAIFHESLPAGGRGVFRVLAFVAVVVGAALLTRSTEPKETTVTSPRRRRSLVVPLALMLIAATIVAATIAALSGGGSATPAQRKPLILRSYPPIGVH